MPARDGWNAVTFPMAVGGRFLAGLVGRLQRVVEEQPEPIIVGALLILHQLPTTVRRGLMRTGGLVQTVAIILAFPQDAQILKPAEERGFIGAGPAQAHANRIRNLMFAAGLLIIAAPFQMAVGGRFLAGAAHHHKLAIKSLGS